MKRKEDPFYPAKLPVRRALEHIESLAQRCADYLSSEVFEPFTTYGGNPIRGIEGVRVVRDIPEDIEDDVIRFVVSLRGALDKAVNGAAQMLRSEALRYAPFPFGDYKRQFEQQLASKKGPWRGIPEDIHEYLKSLHPYPPTENSPNGNRRLSMLGSLSNPAKHENVLMIDVEVASVGWGPKPGSNYAFVSHAIAWPIWNKERTECRIVHRPLGVFEAQIMPMPVIALNNFGPAIPELREMAIMVQGIVEGIEAVTLDAISKAKA